MIIIDIRIQVARNNDDERDLLMIRDEGQSFGPKSDCQDMGSTAMKRERTDWQDECECEWARCWESRRIV